MITVNQKLAFDKFSKMRVGALFMKMGSGKTRVALELVNNTDTDFMLYLCPFSTKGNIEKEIKKWGIRCDYEIVGYETISSSDVKYLELLKNMKTKKNAFIIADESIFIKNGNTKRTKRTMELRNLCSYALVLNGTPIVKDEFDLYNQMEFLSHKIIGMNENEFRYKFFNKIRYKKKYESREHTFYKFSEVNADVLNKMVSPYIYQCDLEFSKNEDESYKCVSYIDDDEYYRIKEESLDKVLEYGSSEAIINMLQSLNVIASTYERKNDEVIKYIENKQVIVFCNYLKEIEYYQSKIDCYVITGNTNNRNKVIEAFKNDQKPLLMTYGCGAFSLNLQFCNEIVYSSINFEYSKLEQSKYRIKRLGQERDIKYTYILTDLGITDLVLENIRKKSTLDNLIKQKLQKEGTKWIKDI